MQWHQTNDKQYVYADKTGKILAKVVFKQGYWNYMFSEYLTLEQAKTAAESNPNLNKYNEVPWG